MQSCPCVEAVPPVDSTALSSRRASSSDRSRRQGTCSASTPGGGGAASIGFRTLYGNHRFIHDPGPSVTPSLGATSRRGVKPRHPHRSGQVPKARSPPATNSPARRARQARWWRSRWAAVHGRGGTPRERRTASASAGRASPGRSDTSRSAPPAPPCHLALRNPTAGGVRLLRSPVSGAPTLSPDPRPSSPSLIPGPRWLLPQHTDHARAPPDTGGNDGGGTVEDAQLRMHG